MMIDRRAFLKSLVVGSTRLLVPSTALVVGEEVERRWWALGGLPDYEAEFKRALMRGMLNLEELSIHHGSLYQAMYPAWQTEEVVPWVFR